MRTVIKQTELPFMATAKTKLSPLEQLKKASNLTPERKVIRITGKEDFEFWITPLTIAERESAMKIAKDDANALALRLFVSKAMFEDGRRMFGDGQIDELKNEVTAEIMDKLMLVLLPDTEEVEGLDPKD